VAHCSGHGLLNLLFKMHPCGLHDCHPEQMGEFAHVQTLDDNMKLFGKKQVSGAVQVRELIEKQLYTPTMDYGLIVNPEGIPGCEVMPEDVQGVPGCKATPEDVGTREATGCDVTPEDIARQDAVKTHSPSKTMTNRCLHASNLQLTNRQGHENEIGDMTQVLDPGED